MNERRTMETLGQWEVFAITLDAEGERYRKFLASNKHLSIKPFTAIKGSDLQRVDIVSSGLVTKDLSSSPLLTAGAIGCAASHRKLWTISARENKGLLVLEDDCQTHQQVESLIDSNISTLMSCDICLFGVNTDSIMESTSPEGLQTLTLFDQKHPSGRWIEETLARTDIRVVRIHRLLKAFGTSCYFISPTGARKMDRYIFPLSSASTNIPGISDEMPMISIDRAACNIYPDIAAFVCRPFLAYSSNIESSTLC